MDEDKGAQVFTNRTNKCFSNLRIAKSYWNQILPYISEVKFENLWLLASWHPKQHFWPSPSWFTANQNPYLCHPVSVIAATVVAQDQGISKGWQEETRPSMCFVMINQTPLLDRKHLTVCWVDVLPSFSLMPWWFRVVSLHLFLLFSISSMCLYPIFPTISFQRPACELL